VIRGERLVLSIPVVILIPRSREKNLGLNSELIHNRNGPEMFRFAQRDNAFSRVTRTFFK
jgi:hypothetical protein